MRAKSILAIIVGALAWLTASPASAAVKQFPAGSLIIPMDECHQFTSHGIGQFYRQKPICHCPTSPADDGMLRAYGLVYRLLEHGIIVNEIISETKTTIEGVDFRINEPADGSEVVVMYDQTDGTFDSFYKDNCAPDGDNKYIEYRGAPWVISAEGGMALQAMQLMRDGSAGIGGTLRGAFDANDFYEVNIHMAQTSFEAPVRLTLNTPPRALALLDLGGGGGGSAGLQVGVEVLITYLDIIGLNTPGAGGTACNPGSVFGQFSSHTDFANDCLATQDYFVLWAPHWEGDDRPQDAIVVQKLAEFADAGHAVFAECAAIPTMEGDHLWIGGLPSACGNNQTCEEQITLCGGFSCTTFFNAEDGHAFGHFQMSNGLVRNGLDKSYGINNTEGFIYRDVSNPFVQKAELRYHIGDSHTGNWRPAKCDTCEPKWTTVGGTPGQSTYGADTERLISSCADLDYEGGNTQQCRRTQDQPDSAFVDPNSNWDYFTMRRKDGDPDKGPILYLGGHQYDSLNPAGVRLVANTLLFLESVVSETQDPQTREFARSAPIVTNVGGVLTYMQGTFLRDDPEPEITTFLGNGPGGFEFPHTQGHIWGFDATTLQTVPTDYYQLGVPLFDAKVLVPNGDVDCTTYFTGQCRTMFTNVQTGAGPNRELIFPNNTALPGPLGLTPTQSSAMLPLIRRGAFGVGGIRTEGFGGVDYSTMAVIPASPVAGGQRPTMIYAGGKDGGMRAVCGEVAGPCNQPGAELWNYIPRTQLPLLKENAQGIQGSPVVADLFGDFAGNGLRDWRTILAFQTGHGTPNLTPDQSPAVLAMDITDPGNPQIVWEVSTRNPTTAEFDLGVGLRLAMGPVLIDGLTQPAVFVQTNNGGDGGAGFSVRALSALDGSELWNTNFDQLYPAPRTAGNAPVPASGIPAGVTAVDLEGNGAISALLVPTLYGDLWLLDATTGQSVYGNNPLFRFSGDFQPIGSRASVFKSGGELYALIVSGGYVDTVSPSAWIRNDVSHFAVAIKIETPSGVVPLTETDTDADEVLFVLDLGAGNLGFSQALIAGDEVFIVTSDADINNLEYGSGSGTLIRYDISEGNQTNTALGSAIGSSAAIDINSGTVYVSGTDKAMQIDFSADFDATGGEGVDLLYQPRATKTLWLSLD